MMSRPSILPDEAVFADFRKQCLSVDNWQKKYDNNDMQVWVEHLQAKKGKQAPKVHKIKVSPLEPHHPNDQLRRTGLTRGREL